MFEDLKQYLDNATPEQLEKDWAELGKWNKVGPDVDEILGPANDDTPIADQRGWHTEKPTEDCYVLLMTTSFPKNCFYVVAEWDNDAQCFYSESSDYPIEDWDYWKLIEAGSTDTYKERKEKHK